MLFLLKIFDSSHGHIVLTPVAVTVGALLKLVSTYGLFKVDSGNPEILLKT